MGQNQSLAERPHSGWRDGLVDAGFAIMFFRLMLLAFAVSAGGTERRLQEPMPPWVLRPLVALWWAAHFAMAGWMAAMFHLFSHHGTGGGQWVVMISRVAAGFCGQRVSDAKRLRVNAIAADTFESLAIPAVDRCGTGVVRDFCRQPDHSAHSGPALPGGNTRLVIGPLAAGSHYPSIARPRKSARAISFHTRALLFASANVVAAVDT